MAPAAFIDRFRSDLDRLIEPGTRIGIAVSGGPDSMALLLLAAAARPGEILAATVDHGLRTESRAEAEIVAAECARLGIPHAILPIAWELPPTSAVQESARNARYAALASWMRGQGVPVLMTAHHLDDQAETLLMRFNRGSGVKGLAGMRARSPLTGAADLKLVRPLLEWRRCELEDVCAEAGVKPAADPSNDDERYERVRIRKAISDSSWLDPESLARSASHLGFADEAITWATDREWEEKVTVGDDRVSYTPSGAPAEIVRRVLSRAIATLGTEGCPNDLRSREIQHVIDTLRSSGTATLRGVRCSGGPTWIFTPAKPRCPPS
ncbi:tRNA lysidine(34) synthetase TilS [Sphingomonas daechungensis]|uniref:tRNA lysidine(34) synthetase TilS n=1 Tax=Sphingomonas daechungensis TaxID=1176646 RepID=UPI00378502C7